MNNRLIYESATVGGIFAALMDSIPFLNLINCLCCLGIALGGVLALFYYRARSPHEPDEFTMPALVHLGLLTGIIGALISFVMHYIVFLFFGNWEVNFLKNLMETTQTLPSFWEEFYRELESGKYDGFAGPMILVRSLFLFPVFTFLGIQIANRFFGKGKPPKEA